MPNPISFPATEFAEILNIQFEQPARKREKSYGLKLVKSLWSGVNSTSGYFGTRNEQWKINDDLVKGKVTDTSLFLQQMGVDTKDPAQISYTPLDLTLLKILPRYFQATLGEFMEREEKPTVTATDILSLDTKEFRKMYATYVHQNKEQLAQMQQASGQEVEPGVPQFEDLDELEMYFKVEDRLPEEMFFEKTVQEIFQNSDFEDLKRQVVSDLIKKNHGVTKIVRNNSATQSPANRLSIRRCKPDRVVYNVFESPVGKDVSLIGEGFPISVADARRQFPDVTEKEWFELARKSTTGTNLLNPIAWQERYITDFSRPYDDYKFIIFDFEVKVVDKEYYVKKTDPTGRETLIKKKGRPAPQTGELVEESKFNMYCGVWAVDTEIMLHWDLATNMIRPYQNGIDCFSTYSIVIPDNDGSQTVSLLERGIACVRKMILTALKIDQMVVEMRPDGISIDIAGLRDLDIGTGKALQPLEIKKIYKQTGDILWDSTDSTGTGGEGNPMPFQNIQNAGNVAQINALIGVYNFWMARLNDEWGTNPDALGMPIPARRSNKVNQNQIEQANKATEYIYDFFIYLCNQNATKLAMMLWDIIIFEASDFKGMDGMDQKLIDAKFDANFDMIPVNENKQRLQQKIDIALEKGTITLGQSIRLENMENIKDAELYLIKLETKAMQSQQANQAQQIQMNAQVQQQSLQAKAQADDLVNQGKAKYEAMVNSAKFDSEGFNQLIKMVSDLQVESMVTGKPIPQQVQPLIDFVLQTVLQKQVPQQPQQQEQPQPGNPDQGQEGQEGQQPVQEETQEQAQPQSQMQ